MKLGFAAVLSGDGDGDFTRIWNTISAFRFRSTLGKSAETPKQHPYQKHLRDYETPQLGRSGLYRSGN